MGFWVSKSTSLARFYLVADPVTRQDMIDMLAQGKVPEASHLCGHGWCERACWDAVLHIISNA